MRHHHTRSHGSRGGEPVLTGPADAVAAIRLSAPPAEGPAIVVLLCDRDHRLLLAVVVEGAGAEAVRSIIDLVAAVADPAGVAAIIVGIVRDRLGGFLPKREGDGLRGVVTRCEAAGVEMLDVVLVGPRGWRSVFDLAVRPEGDEDGTR